MCFLKVNRDLPIPVEFADPAGLFLRKQEAAIGGTNYAVGVIGPLPGYGPSGALCHHSGNRRYGDFANTLRLLCGNAQAQR